MHRATPFASTAARRQTLTTTSCSCSSGGTFSPPVSSPPALSAAARAPLRLPRPAVARAQFGSGLDAAASSSCPVQKPMRSGAYSSKLTRRRPHCVVRAPHEAHRELAGRRIQVVVQQLTRLGLQGRHKRRVRCTQRSMERLAARRWAPTHMFVPAGLCVVLRPLAAACSPAQPSQVSPCRAGAARGCCRRAGRALPPRPLCAAAQTPAARRPHPAAGPASRVQPAIELNPGRGIPGHCVRSPKHAPRVAATSLWLARACPCTPLPSLFTARAAPTCRAMSSAARAAPPKLSRPLRASSTLVMRSRATEAAWMNLASQGYAVLC